MAGDSDDDFWGGGSEDGDRRELEREAARRHEHFFNVS
jgi:hypothetical protein